MKFTPKRRVLASLLGGRIDRVPVTSVAGCGGTVTVDMQETVGIYWPEAHKDPDKMAKLAVASHQLTGLESVRVPFDFVVESEALGCEIKPGDKKIVPQVTKHPFEKPEDLKMPDDLLQAGRIPVVLEAIRKMREEVGDFLPISSLVLGPLTLAAELSDTANLLRWTMKKPDYVEKFVDFATEVVIRYGKAQYRAGSDIVEVGEPVASASLISPKMFKEFAKPALIRVAEELGGIRVLHICGNALPMIPDMVETGFDGISIEEDVDVAKIKPLVGDVKILGNVSSKGALVMGDPNQVEDESRKALEAGVDLLEPGCGISPITPIDNIKAMVKAATSKSV
jgi:[methyl-Co(III) methanol-specific corrinoid protein]:coenzyme M methyltransferase